MSTDIQKGDPKKDGNKEVYLLDDINTKQQTNSQEPSEDSPLKGYCDVSNMDSKENDANLSSSEKVGGSKEGRGKGLREWLSKSRVKWWIAVLVAVVLLTVVLVGTLLAVEDDSDDFEDNAIRLVKLWPRPNRPKNTINFVHGTREGTGPFEGEIWPEMITELDSLLSHYQIRNRSGNLLQCYGVVPHKGKVCTFSITHIDFQCSKSVNYGYDRGQPCVFLEFNNISYWQPEPYTPRELETLPDLPHDLRYSKQNLVFLDCQGDSLVDRENMGPIDYSPDRGFPYIYFPYQGQEEYMSPLIAIRFGSPAIGVAISVTCKLWSKNINHTDDAIPSGKISFNLLVD